MFAALLQPKRNPPSIIQNEAADNDSRKSGHGHGKRTMSEISGQNVSRGKKQQLQSDAASSAPGDETQILEEDKPTPFDVAIAATRDLHMQQARGYGAYTLRSVMLIRYFQKVSTPYKVFLFCFPHEYSGGSYL